MINEFSKLTKIKVTFIREKHVLGLLRLCATVVDHYVRLKVCLWRWNLARRTEIGMVRRPVADIENRKRLIRRLNNHWRISVMFELCLIFYSTYEGGPKNLCSYGWPKIVATRPQHSNKSILAGVPRTIGMLVRHETTSKSRWILIGKYMFQFPLLKSYRRA